MWQRSSFCVCDLIVVGKIMSNEDWSLFRRVNLSMGSNAAFRWRKTCLVDESWSTECRILSKVRRSVVFVHWFPIIGLEGVKVGWGYDMILNSRTFTTWHVTCVLFTLILINTLFTLLICSNGNHLFRLQVTIDFSFLDFLFGGLQINFTVNSSWHFLTPALQLYSLVGDLLKFYFFIYGNCLCT